MSTLESILTPAPGATDDASALDRATPTTPDTTPENSTPEDTTPVESRPDPESLTEQTPALDAPAVPRAVDSGEVDSRPDAGEIPAPAVLLSPAPPTPAPNTAVPYLRIRPSSGWAALNLIDVWHYRDLLFSLAGRDLKLRYKQTALGIIWVVLQPLMAAGIFTFVFGVLAAMPSDGVPYFVLSFAGLLGWNLFNNTVTKASGCLIGNQQLISKVFFPRLVLPLSTVPSTLVDFACAAGMMALLLLVYRIPPHAGLLLLPVWMLLLLCFSLGIGLITSALTVSYRDVQYILPVMMQVLLYASPIAYSLTRALQKLPPTGRLIFQLNPLAPLLEAFRWSLLGTTAPALLWLLYAATISILTFVLGAFAFKKMERKFADVI